MVLSGFKSSGHLSFINDIVFKKVSLAQRGYRESVRYQYFVVTIPVGLRATFEGSFLCFGGLKKFFHLNIVASALKS